MHSQRVIGKGYLRYKATLKGKALSEGMRRENLTGQELSKMPCSKAWEVNPAGAAVSRDIKQWR